MPTSPLSRIQRHPQWLHQGAVCQPPRLNGLLSQLASRVAAQMRARGPSSSSPSNQPALPALLMGVVITNRAKDRADAQ
ncbi:hypothetical protein N7449_012540 [Penicillium cf. viridicatum]|uniref:Uncharacterized protein n=1 Tax=Penicillium cf. viridicatum TaxID=2972119 RepID=A0A9W9IL11_9EURO|nr:hypothetical protein N7449_012540 [Penicillium cf. viridicatum]